MVTKLLESMTILRLSREFYSVGWGLCLTLGVAACSGSDGTADGENGGTGAVAGDESSPGGSSTSGGTSGASSSGGSNSSGAMAGSGATSDEVIGAFTVEVTADEEDPTTGSTQVIGKVSNAALPAAVIWEVAQEDGDCRLEKPSVPFCDPGCGGEICAAENTCLPYPTGQSVGEVTITGLSLEGGGDELVLKEVAKNYQAPPGTVFAFPPFEEGAAVQVHAAGGDYPGFDLSATGVAPLVFTSSDFALEEGKAFELTWDAASDPKASSVHLKLDISHHGGTRGMIECDKDDDGSLTISAALMTELIGLGVAGFPTVELSRLSTDSATIPQGHVVLTVSSKTSQAVSIAGLQSCNADTCEGVDDPSCLACPDGMTCQTDLTCQ